MSRPDDEEFEPDEEDPEAYEEPEGWDEEDDALQDEAIEEYQALWQEQEQLEEAEAAEAAVKELEAAIGRRTTAKERERIAEAIGDDGDIPSGDELVEMYGEEFEGADETETRQGLMLQAAEEAIEAAGGIEKPEPPTRPETPEELMAESEEDRRARMVAAGEAAEEAAA